MGKSKQTSYNEVRKQTKNIATYKTTEEECNWFSGFCNRIADTESTIDFVSLIGIKLTIRIRSALMKCINFTHLLD